MPSPSFVCYCHGDRWLNAAPERMPRRLRILVRRVFACSNLQPKVSCHEEGRKPRKRRLRLVASPDSRGDVALEEKSGLGSMGSSCASPSVSKCRAKPRASFDTVPVLAEKITSKKPKSESADRAASEESADHAASEASGGQSRRSLGSAERDVDIQKEEPTADDPDCPSRWAVPHVLEVLVVVR